MLVLHVTSEVVHAPDVRIAEGARVTSLRVLDMHTGDMLVQVLFLEEICVKSGSENTTLLHKEVIERREPVEHPGHGHAIRGHSFNFARVELSTAALDRPVWAVSRWQWSLLLCREGEYKTGYTGEWMTHANGRCTE